ncbi:MAG: Na(+)-translocating NADH-quinone reductase subunit A [Saprospiraceae bacterium]|nr:Na(+)-translocating NADH-quinone reductase subunit A [Saprospiraceae bacterium]
MLIAALVIVGVVLVLAAVFSISDNLIQIEAQKEGIDTMKNNLSLVPSFKEFFGKPAPKYADANNYHLLSKGHDIKLTGKPSSEIVDVPVTRFAVKPGDFRGNAPIPKMVVEEGDEVKAGDVLFFDKTQPDIKYTAPVSGEIVEIRRGAKRSISHVIIMADKEQRYKQFDAPSTEGTDREKLVQFLIESGAWAHINQRPYDVVADTELIPQNIFVSTFDSAPLATDLNLIAEGNGPHFQKGLDILNQLTSGMVYLGLDARGEKPHPTYTEAQGVQKHWFNGKHPVGNVGVQIHHTAPIRGINTVWTLTPESVMTIGRLFNEGIYKCEKVVSLTGGQVKTPMNVRTSMGASVSELLKGNLLESKTRVIIGDVLSGSTAGEDDFLSIDANQITAIKEGDNYELFGWLLPVTPRPSVSRTFPNFLMGNHEFEANTNTHGEERAFVVTGQYEKMLPMDIYPQHLMKAIMTGEIEKMEALGINEMSEEDIALAEFACTSKMPLQSILREGLDMMREQA